MANSSEPSERERRFPWLRLRQQYNAIVAKSWLHSTSSLWVERPRARSAARFVGWLALMVLAVELAYLAVANIILGGGLLENWASGDDFVLAYDSAYSVLPGRVNVKNFKLRTSDRNVQIELSIDAVTLDVALHELISKRFHGTRVRSLGTTFKLRYKLDHIGPSGLRVAAYPKIPGYPGPPLRRGPEPPERSRAEQAERWSVRLDDVVARIKELWFVEYHFQGQAVASGAFELRPGLLLSLDPSKLKLESGTLHVGERLLAQRIRGVLNAKIIPTDLEKVQGRQIFETASARFAATLVGGSLAFMDVYLVPQFDLTANGGMRMTFDVGLERGYLTPDSKVRLVAPRAALSVANHTFEGDLAGYFRVRRGPSEPRLVLGASSKRLRAEGQSAPEVRGVQAVMEVAPLGVAEELRLEGARVSLQALNVPTFAWFERLLPGHPRLAGSGVMSGEWQRTAAQPPSGNVRLTLDQCSFSTPETKLRLDATLSSRFRQPKDATLAFEGFDLALKNVLLQLGREGSSSWSAAVRSNSLRVLDRGAVQGTFDVSVNRTRALLPLVLPDVPSQLAASLLGLEELEARLALYVSHELTRVEILQAHSGPLSLEGIWQRRSGDGNGSFLLRSPAMNFGLRVNGNSTEVSLGAGAKFLSGEGAG